MKKEELIIIGGGPTGINCAIEATKKGLDYLILEKGVLVNSLFHFPFNMTFFSTSVNLEIGDIPFISHTDKPTRKEALEYYRRLYDHYNLKIAFRRMVLSLEASGDGYIIKTNRENYFTKQVIVATGFYDQPNLMNIPGEELKKVKHYYDEAHHYIDQKVIVVGGANSACDVALETWQKGADVTMVIRQKELYRKVKYWILPNIQNRINEGSIKAYFSSTLSEIKVDEVVINTEEGFLTIANDYVLAMTGYRPDYKLLGNLGIQINDDGKMTPVFNDDNYLSNLPNVYLAGTVLGGLHTSKYFIENSREQASKIISHILNVKR